MSEEKTKTIEPQTVESIERSENAMIIRTKALVIENGDLLQASERIAGMVESLRSDKRKLLKYVRKLLDAQNLTPE